MCEDVHESFVLYLIGIVCGTVKLPPCCGLVTTSAFAQVMVGAVVGAVVGAIVGAVVGANVGSLKTTTQLTTTADITAAKSKKKRNKLLQWVLRPESGERGWPWVSGLNGGAEASANCAITIGLASPSCLEPKGCVSSEVSHYY